MASLPASDLASWPTHFSVRPSDAGCKLGNPQSHLRVQQIHVHNLNPGLALTTFFSNRSPVPSSEFRVPTSAHSHLTPSNAQTNCNQLPLFWEIWLRRVSLAHTTPSSLGPAHCSLLAATRALLSKGRPSGPGPRGAPSSPGHHSTDEVQQQQAEGAQVLRGHGVAWSCTLGLPCRCVR